jgi:hypothetical protein
MIQMEMSFQVEQFLTPATALELQRQVVWQAEAVQALPHLAALQLIMEFLQMVRREVKALLQIYI